MHGPMAGSSGGGDSDLVLLVHWRVQLMCKCQ
jgi:hypothetical protein